MELELLRYSKSVWGQKMLVGVSWDLIWVPVVAALLIIAAHQAIRSVKRGTDRPDD